jgi:putative pyruvate formate lyase activating enzyme
MYFKNFKPSYLELYKTGELEKRLNALKEKLTNCDLCPRRCGVNRFKEKGTYCKTGINSVVSSSGPHFGEESPLVGTTGSGTIFFTFCNLRCCFCQNYEISQLGIGEEVNTRTLARMMISLQERGCVNINFVTPTHVVFQIAEALLFAVEDGLRIPLVYNSSGYDSEETIRLLDGIFDIYMPDIKYSDNENAKKYSGAPDYFEFAKGAVKEMHRQVGDLQLSDEGIAIKGLIVRHLVLPEGLAGTEKVMKFIAEEVSVHTYINIMEQFRPCYRAKEFNELSRRISPDEFEDAISIAKKFNLYRFDGLYSY